jgi:hypothetical protein
MLAENGPAVSEHLRTQSAIRLLKGMIGHFNRTPVAMKATNAP